LMLSTAFVCLLLVRMPLHSRLRFDVSHLP
jgi:hypothetical protein